MSVPNGAANKKRIAAPPISIKYPGIKHLAKDEVVNFKLRSQPAKASSPVHKLAVAFFKSGTPEEYLKFCGARSAH